MMKPKDYDQTMKIRWGQQILEPKIDGIRACYKNSEFISYNGKPIYNIQPIMQELRAVQMQKGDFLDGELWSESGGWEKTMSIVKSSKTLKPIEDVKFYIFDYVLGQNADMTLLQRKRLIDKLWDKQKHNWQHIQGVCWEIVESKKEFLSSYQIYQECGFEGIMIKNQDSPYHWMKRSKEWLRHKPTKTEDVTIVGVKQGVGKYAQTLGSLVCVDQHGKNICVSVGSDAERDKYWKRKKSLKGVVIEVKFFKRTANGTMYSAHLVREREDKC